MDSTFYDKFYSQMTKGAFIGMAKATPETFQLSIHVPESITHVKRLHVERGSVTLYEEFVDKISALKTANKLGAILFQLPTRFTVNDFKNIEQFVDRLPPANGCDCAMEFRHPSWGTEGPWEMFKHYNIAAVTTDSPIQENLQFLSDVIVTANYSFIRFHGRNLKGHYWCNYLYTEQGDLKDHRLKLQSKESEIEYFGLRHQWDTVAAFLATLMTPI